MRRILAFGLVAAALLALVVFGYLGATCGARQVDEPCASAEECAALSRCVPFVHPMIVPMGAIALAAGAGVAARVPTFALMAGLLVVALGTVGMMGFGAAGVGVGALLVAAGVVAPGRSGREAVERRLRWAAVAAAIATPLLFVGVLLTAVPSLPLVWLAVGMPTLGWLAYVGWALRRSAPAIAR